MEDQDKAEMEDLKSVLQNNKYKPWMLKTPQRAIQKPKGTAKKGSFSYSVQLSCVQGVSEQLTQVFRKQGVGTYHKSFNTITQHLVHPKDPKAKKKMRGGVQNSVQGLRTGLHR